MRGEISDAGANPAGEARDVMDYTQLEKHYGLLKKFKAKQVGSTLNCFLRKRGFPVHLHPGHKPGFFMRPTQVARFARLPVAKAIAGE